MSRCPVCLIFCAVALTASTLALAQEPPATAEPARLAGSDVPVPRRSHFVMPEYPAEAVAAGLRGIVILEIVIDPQGNVAFAEVVRSVPPFDAAALAAVRQWTYEPTKVEGRPVSVRLTVPITFAIKVPEVARAEGVPELRMGAAPVAPAGPSGTGAAAALMLIGPDGTLLEAQITDGSAALSEALMQAVRTWRFAARDGAEALQVRLLAEFAPGKVALRLTEPRKTPLPAAASASPAATPVAAAAEPAAPVATAATPTAPLAAPPPAPVTAPPPAATASPAAPVPAAPPPPQKPAPAPPRPRPAAPQEEVIPAAPRPPAAATPAPATPLVPESGVSALRDVTLGSNIPDLVSGRRPMVPPVARMAGVSGSVVVLFSVDAAGDVLLQSAEGAPELVVAARAAVASWKFRRLNTARIGLRGDFTFAGDKASARVERVAE